MDSSHPPAAILHYRPPWHISLPLQLRFRPAASDSTTTTTEWRTIADSERASPIHPDYVVFRIPLVGDAGSISIREETKLSFTAVTFVPFVPSSDKIATREDTPAGADHWTITAPGTYVLADKELTCWGEDCSVSYDQFNGALPNSSFKDRHALFFDIDGTLRGENKLAEFVRVWERKLALSGAILCFNTGRSVRSVYDWMREISHAVVPTATICRVGAEIRWFRSDTGWHHWAPTVDHEWVKKLDGAGGWDWLKVRDLIRAPLESHTRVKGKLSVPVTRADPLPPYVTYILTFMVRRAYAAEAVRVVRAALGDGIRVKISVSGEGVDTQYMDVINVRAGKLGGLRYICQRLQFAPERCVMAGDSGNDLDALMHDGEEKGIIVGNCQVELDEFWRRLNEKEPGQTRVVKTIKHCSAGIVEGLESLGFL